MDSPKERRSSFGIAAAFIALGYAAVFAIAASVVGVQFVTATGSIDRKHLTGVAARGVLLLVVALIVTTVMLSVGAARLLRFGRPGWVVGPLGAFIVIGCIGETVDLYGTASIVSDAVGAGIIALAVMPVVLIAIDRRTLSRR